MPFSLRHRRKFHSPILVFLWSFLETALFLTSDISAQSAFAAKTSKIAIYHCVAIFLQFWVTSRSWARGNTNRSFLLAIACHSPCPVWNLRLPKPTVSPNFSVIPNPTSKAASPLIRSNLTGKKKTNPNRQNYSPLGISRSLIPTYKFHSPPDSFLQFWHIRVNRPRIIPAPMRTVGTT